MSGPVRVGNRAYRNSNRTTFLDNELQHPVALDPNDAQDAAIIGQANRMRKDENFEGLVELHATAGLFTTKQERPPEVVGKRQVYLLTKNGTQFEHRDPTTLKTMTDQGFEITGTKDEDIIG